MLDVANTENLNQDVKEKDGIWKRDVLEICLYIEQKKKLCLRSSK